MVDLEYFVKELHEEGHEVVVFMDANQNEARWYRPQTHDQKFKSDTGFNIDGTIDGSLKTFVQNTGLHNIINTKHGNENVPPLRSPGSSVIDYVYVSEGILEHAVGIGMLNLDAVFDSDHMTFFLDIDFESFFGTDLDNITAPQFRQLQLDYPRIAEGYGNILHKLFTNHNVYKSVKRIAARGHKEDWTIKDENLYEEIDRDNTRSMLSAAKQCSVRKMHKEPWSLTIGLATNTIRYWDVWVKHKGDRNPT
jgi:hypothetical protein